MTIRVIGALLLSSLAYCQVYVCPPDICHRVDCLPPELMDCPGGIEPLGGRCGCCDSCATPVATCAMVLEGVQSSQQTGEPIGPRCESDGSYNPVQCSGDSCHCVNSTGHLIYRDYVRKTLPYQGSDQESMNCHCAREEHDFVKTGMVGRFFNCAGNGNYDTVGCSGNVCYCTDEYGKQVGTTTTYIWERHLLVC